MPRRPKAPRRQPTRHPPHERPTRDRLGVEHRCRHDEARHRHKTVSRLRRNRRVVAGFRRCRMVDSQRRGNRSDDDRRAGHAGGIRRPSGRGDCRAYCRTQPAAHQRGHRDGAGDRGRRPVRAGRASPAGARPQRRVRLLRHRARDPARHRGAPAREPERAERSGGGPHRRHRAPGRHHRAIARSGARIVGPVRNPGVQRSRRHHRGDLQPLRAGGGPRTASRKAWKRSTDCTKRTCS